MNVYIDDLRDPAKYLSPELAKDIVWIKKWWDAKVFLHDNQDKIEVIHFDHYMDVRDHTGGDLLEMVYFYKTRGDEFPLLKTVYLHSSDKAVVKRLIERFKDKFIKYGVEMINNSQRF